jgi:hypothetical protein
VGLWGTQWSSDKTSYPKTPESSSVNQEQYVSIIRMLLLQKEGWSFTAACVRYQYNRMPVKSLLSYSSHINVLHCDRNRCVYLEVLFTGEPISPTFHYYVQDWGSGSDLSVSSSLLGYDAVLLCKQFPDFSEGHCHLLQGLRRFWRDYVLNIGNYRAASNMVLYPMKPPVLNFNIVYCGGMEC